MDSWDQSPSLPVPLDILLDIVVHLPLQSVLALRLVRLVSRFRVLP